MMQEQKIIKNKIELLKLAETLGSVAAWLCLEEGWSAVGLDINANHLRAVREGWVHGHCRPVHVGRSTQVWHHELYIYIYIYWCPDLGHIPHHAI